MRVWIDPADQSRHYVGSPAKKPGRTRSYRTLAPPAVTPGLGWGRVTPTAQLPPKGQRRVPRRVRELAVGGLAPARDGEGAPGTIRHATKRPIWSVATTDLQLGDGVQIGGSACLPHRRLDHAR